TEVEELLGDATKAKEKLGWNPGTSVQQLAAMMVDADMDMAKREKTLVDAGHEVSVARD
ncbi:MAG: GDP-mannose 4,6-dehydratase, partial [Planctomycetota bacterium]